MEKGLWITLIFQCSLIPILYPIFAYLLWKWYRYRHHFVIKNRFPKISITIFICCILSQLLSLLQSLTNIDFSHICIALSSIEIGLIFYRTHLVYVRWSMTTQYLLEMNKYTSDSQVITIKSTSKIIDTVLLHLIFIINVIMVPLTILITRYLNISATGPLFSIPVIIGILIVINILRAKVQESIGCIRESLLAIVCAITLSVGIVPLQSISPKYISVATLGGLIQTSLVAFFILFIAIHLMYKAQRNDRNNSIGTRMIETSTSPSTPPSSQNNPTESEIPKFAINVKQSAKKPLYKFLKSQQHYKLFAGYLSQCFALENLLFIERSIILHHIILKYKALDSHFPAKHKKEEIEDMHFDHKCYGITFDYLSKIYVDIKAMIEDAVILNTENDDMAYKRGIIAVLKLVYQQFCDNSSETQINVSYGVQHPLQQLMTMDDEEEMMKIFDCYDKLLSVLHDATIEVWAVCESVYGFQFRCYVGKYAK